MTRGKMSSQGRVPSPVRISAIFLLLATTYLCVPSEAVSKNFRGGHIHTEVKGTQGNNVTVEVTVLAAWLQNASPCGPGCTFMDIGLSTTTARADQLRRGGNTAMFGQFSTETGFQDLGKQTVVRDITTYVNSNSKGQVFDVDDKAAWVQETLTFNLTLTSDSLYQDVIIRNLTWPDLLQSCTPSTQPCTARLQRKLTLGVRNDTKQHNRAPLLSYRPVYRVPLDTVSHISVYAADPDGDLVSCRWARFVELGPLSLPPGVSVSSECELTVNTSRALGFKDLDYIAIPLIVEEVLVNPVLLSNGETLKIRNAIGATKLSLLVHIGSNDAIPEFVPEISSPCGIDGDKDVMTYTTYLARDQDSFIFLPLMAKPGNGSDKNTEIERFRVTSRPPLSVNLMAPQDVPGRLGDRARLSDLTTTVRESDAGQHFLQLLAMDTQGELSHACTLRVDIATVDYTRTTDQFLGTPSPSDITCPASTQCGFPIYVQSGSSGKQPSLTVTSSDPSLTEVLINNAVQTVWQGVQSTRFQINVMGSKPGSFNICLLLTLPSKSTSQKCITIQVAAPNPCIKSADPCTHPSRGSCHVNQTNPALAHCQCRPWFTGRHCEVQMDPCLQGYCGSNAVHCAFDPVILPEPMCICAANFTGARCEHSLGCVNNNPCLPHGDCLPTGSSFTCSCHQGYSGPLCEQPAGSLLLSSSTPTTSVGLTESLVLNCTFLPVQDPDAAKVVYLAMFYSNSSSLSGFREIASVTADSGAVITSQTPDMGALSVSGGISSTNTSSLLLTVQQPHFGDSRYFRCDAEAVDARGPLSRSSDTVLVKGERSTIDKLQAEITALRKQRDLLLAGCKTQP